MSRCPDGIARTNLYKIIKYLSIASVVMCIVFFAVVIQSFYRHRFIFHDLVISLLDSFYINMLALGALLFLLNIICFKINRNLKNQPTNWSFPRTHHVWVAFQLIALISTFTCVLLISWINSVIHTEVGPRFKHGISLYMESSIWGSNLDSIQTYLKCCGIRGPADWYATSWIPYSQVLSHNIDTRLVQPNGRVLVPLVPNSCCRVPSTECGHRAWIEAKTKSWSDIKPASPNLVYSTGCEEAINKVLVRDVLLIKILLISVFVSQVVLLVLSRYLQTSTRNSLYLGRPLGKAPGWIMGPGFFSLKTRWGYLLEFENSCRSATPSEDEERKVKDKCNIIKKMKCLKKSKKKDDSDTSESPKSKKKYFKCLGKAKESCSNTFKKVRRKKDKNRKVETESELEKSTKVETSRGSRRSSKTILRKHQAYQTRPSEDVEYLEEEFSSDQNHKPLRAGNLQQYNVDMRNDSNPFNQNRDHFKMYENANNAKAGPNTFTPKTREVEVFEVDAETQSPFLSNHPNDHQQFPNSLQYPENETHYVKSPSAKAEDFKKTRELFENATQGINNMQNDEINLSFVDRRPGTNQHDVNLIQFDNTTTDNSYAESMYTTKRPIVLRNYPLLSPL